MFGKFGLREIDDEIVRQIIIDHECGKSVRLIAVHRKIHIEIVVEVLNVWMRQFW